MGIIKNAKISNGQLLFNSEFFYWIFLLREISLRKWPVAPAELVIGHCLTFLAFVPVFFPAPLGLTIGQFNCGMDWHCFFCCFSLRCSLLIKSKQLKFVTNFFRFLSAPKLMLVSILDQIAFTEKWRQKNHSISVPGRGHRTTFK